MELGFSTYKIMSSKNRDGFNSSSFFFPTYLLWLGLPKLCLIKGEWYPWKLFQSFTLEYDVSYGFFIDGLFNGDVASISSLSVFIMKGC